MATATERKFTSLRKRLDQVGYRQPLGLESLPLVDKLFGDLLHTTESLKTAKQQLGKHREEKVTKCSLPPVALGHPSVEPTSLTQ